MRKKDFHDIPCAYVVLAGQNYESAITANPAPQFIKRFQMRHGLGVMPAFKKDMIMKNDLRDISKYLHAWKHY